MSCDGNRTDSFHPNDVPACGVESSCTLPLQGTWQQHSLLLHFSSQERIKSNQSHVLCQALCVCAGKKMNELKAGHRPLCWISCLLWSAYLTTPRHYSEAVVETDIDLYLLMILVYVRASHFCVRFWFFFSVFCCSCWHKHLCLEKKRIKTGEKNRSASINWPVQQRRNRFYSNLYH